MEEISIFTIIDRIKKNRKLFVTSFFVTAIVSYLLIFPLPRYYHSEVSLAPELPSEDQQSQLSKVASSFGFDLGGGATSDALSPQIYPEVIKTNKFIINLLSIKVETKDKSVRTDYYTYLDRYQKKSIYGQFFKFIGGIFSNKKNKYSVAPSNLFSLTKKQYALFNKIKDNIDCSIDKKNGIITISVKDQDPVVAATLANEVMNKLQDFIIKYRTDKARRDVAYYTKLASEAKAKYERSRQRYGSYSDANMDVIMESYKSKVEDLENNMQLDYNAYSAKVIQLQQAQSKLQEKTPAFTVIEAATVPLKPSGPKRTAFALVMVIFVMIVDTLYVCRDLLKENFAKS